MTKPLINVSILVADDQPDVARTLCRPLGSAGAQLTYVTDAESALAELANRAFDLLLVDMKMPPNDWGGLWLLQQLQDGHWSVPVLALSGEGGKQQVIQALRLGATDWVDKGAAKDELLPRILSIITGCYANAFDSAVSNLATPLAYWFTRYSQLTDPDKKTREGLLALEAVLRFASAIGLSSKAPSPLRGITPQRLAAPSMGTWFDLCMALCETPNVSDDLRRLVSCLAPSRSDRQAIQALVAYRNDLAHGRGGVDPQRSERLDAALRGFAHRASAAWRTQLAVATSMTYDGSIYRLELLKLKGTKQPASDFISIQHPMVTGSVVLLPPDNEPISLSPWLIVPETGDLADPRCLMLDGLDHRKAAIVDGTPLRYSYLDGGAGALPPPGPRRGAWNALAAWTSTP